MNSQNESILNHPEIQDLFTKLTETLLQESDRGAVLVGASIVDEQLRNLFEEIVPSEMSRKERKSLLDYPGPISSLADKIEIAYATRLISRTIYNSLHALRRIRNSVAHAPQSFQLSAQREGIQQIYSLGDGVPAYISRSAMLIMMRSKIEQYMELHGPHGEIPYFNTSQEVFEYLTNDSEILSLLKEQLPKYELVLGIMLLCGLIISCREATAKLVGSNSTLSNIYNASQQVEPGEITDRLAE